MTTRKLGEVPGRTDGVPAPASVPGVEAEHDLPGGHTLVVDHVDITYKVRGKDRLALRDISFSIGVQESFGLVGESGSGKSTMALAVTEYLPQNGRVSAGSIRLNGADVLKMNNSQLREMRAKHVSMVYQEPGRALNPSIRVGRQVAEVFEIAGLDRSAAADRSREMLAKVQISDPSRVMRAYPHQLSGGMLQRAVIAMALATNPALLILDEPTTALDATVEAEVLDLVSALRSEFRTSVLFISHNLAVIAKMCDRVGVLYAGDLVEEGPARQLFEEPRHPYTVGLLRCIPRRWHRKDHGRLDTIPGFLPPPGSQPRGCIFADRCALAEDKCRSEPPPLFEIDATRRSRCFFWERAPQMERRSPVDVALPEVLSASEPVVRMHDLSKTFKSGNEEFKALVGINLELFPGETLGLVGESGSGKTTLARVLLGLYVPDAGALVELDDAQLARHAKDRTRSQLRALRIVFQNPDSALNRRHSVRRLISRPLAKLGGLSGTALDERLLELVHSVRMEERHLSLRPYQLSGGLKQRVAIARAFAGDSQVVVCDEPTSALDVSVQAAILNLLVDLQAKARVTYLFISHDLGVVRYLSDRIAVLYLGRVIELGLAETVFSGPHHPYTEALLSAMLSLDGTPSERIRLTGEIPSAAKPPSGCVFHTRCPRRLASGLCETTEPPLLEVEPGHFMSCHIPIGELRRLQAVEDRLGAAAAGEVEAAGPE
jgi:peptide/nickel transport system ATP-binding protein